MFSTCGAFWIGLFGVCWLVFDILNFQSLLLCVCLLLGTSLIFYVPYLFITSEWADKFLPFCIAGNEFKKIQMLTDCYNPHRINVLASKTKKWKQKPRLLCNNDRHPQSKICLGVPDMQQSREMTQLIDWMEQQPPKVTCILDRCEVSGSFRH